MADAPFSIKISQECTTSGTGGQTVEEQISDYILII